MNKNFTSNDLVQFIYQELSTAENVAIKDAIASDVMLREAYQELSAAHSVLPKAKFSPSRSAIQNILKYSEQSPVTA